MGFILLYLYAAVTVGIVLLISDVYIREALVAAVLWPFILPYLGVLIVIEWLQRQKQ